MKNYAIEDLNAIDSVQCPCGTTKRAFADLGNSPASIHLVDISKKSRVHYHKVMTEIYLILEGEGHMELDGEVVPVKPMSTIMIKPGCRHRAVGNLKIVNIPIPAFIEEDEYFD
jgi:mannose-6-phosphate isomerase-like protein (cupin superfamily)